MLLWVSVLQLLSILFICRFITYFTNTLEENNQEPAHFADWVNADVFHCSFLLPRGVAAEEAVNRLGQTKGDCGTGPAWSFFRTPCDVFLTGLARFMRQVTSQKKNRP